MIKWSVREGGPEFVHMFTYKIKFWQVVMESNLLCNQRR